MLRVPGGVRHGVLTSLHSFVIIRESIDITMQKPYIFWNLTPILRHCHCSSDTLTHCSEMPASCNGQLQILHQVTWCNWTYCIRTRFSKFRGLTPRNTNLEKKFFLISLNTCIFYFRSMIMSNCLQFLLPVENQGYNWLAVLGAEKRGHEDIIRKKYLSKVTFT